MKIALLSQSNVSDKTQTIRVEEIERTTPDIYVEMTQEDSRSLPMMDPEFLQGFTTLHEEQLLKLTRFSGFNVKTKVFVKNNLKDNVKVLEAGAVPIKNMPTIFGKINPVTTKGIVYTKLFITGHKPIIFVNAHLPKSAYRHNSRRYRNVEGLYTTTDTSDYAHNMKLFIEMLQRLHSTGVLDENTTLLLGGNLNFQISEYIKGNTSYYDDLLSLILNGNFELGNRPRISELEFKSANDKIFTCKFDKAKSVYEEFKTCRNTPAGDPGKDGYSSNLALVKNNCGVEDQHPSRCDRFLVGPTKDSKIDVIVHKGKYFPEIDSDHNTLYAVVEYLDSTILQSKQLQNEYAEIKGNFVNALRQKIDELETSVQQCTASCIAAQENVCSSSKDDKCEKTLQQLRDMEAEQPLELFSAMCKNNIIQDPRSKTLCISSIDQQGNITNLLNKYKKDNSDNTNSEEYKLVLKEEARFEKITKNDPESRSKRKTTKAIGGKKRKRRKTKTRRAR
jgi:hypothetical protein